MIGKGTQQSQLFDVGNVYDLELPTSSFYWQLATAAPSLFKDEDFAVFYCAERGRPCVPPLQLSLMTVLKERRQIEDAYLRETGLERYTASSLNGSADLDWSDEQARQALLTQIVADARALLERTNGGSKGARESAQLLSSILLPIVHVLRSSTSFKSRRR